MSLGLLATPTVTICKVAKMVFNVAPGNFYLSQYLEYQEANGTSATVEALAGLAGGTDAAFVTTVLTNLGLADDAGASAFLTSAIAANGRGAALEAAIAALEGVAADDATYGAAKTAFDTATIASVSYSTNVANNSTDTATLAAAISAETTSSSGSLTLVLTDKIDTLTGGAGDDTISGSDDTVSVGDQINGGDGTDTFRLFTDGASTLPQLTSVESVYVNDDDLSNGANDGANFNMLTGGYSTLELDSGLTAVTDENIITAVDGATIILDSLTDGDATDDTANDNGEVSIAGASSVTSVTVVVDDSGAAAAQDDIDVDIAGSAIATLNLQSTGDKNYVGLFNSGSALKTLNITGDTLMDADEDALTGLTTINAADSSGGVKVNITGSTADVTITGGTGDDTFIIGGDLDTSDTINGGDGTDTVSVSDAALTSSTAAVVKGVNGVTNVEVLASSATSSITIDGSKFTAINQFSNTGTVSGTEAASGPSDGVNLTFEAGDSYIIAGAISGGDGSASVGADAGADALEVAAKVNTGTDSITITLDAGAATTITGGSGDDAGSAGDTGPGGAAINASTVETINIVTASKDDDLTLTGGTAGSGAGSDGATLSVGANATVNISGAGDVNLGTVAAPNAATDDLTINGSEMTGVLTVTTGAGNDVITGGSKNDVITAGTGVNSITGGAGNDDFKFADADSSTSALTTITDFTLGANKDKLTFTTAAGTYEALESARATAIAADTTLGAAADEAVGQLAAHEVTAFLYSGHYYVLYESGDNAGTYETDEDVIVKLSGITDITGFDGATQVA